MIFPLSILKSSYNKPLSIELKNGETYNGTLVNIDNYMNLNLREVILTEKDGRNFWSILTVYLRGITVKYLRIKSENINLKKLEKDYKPF